MLSLAISSIQKNSKGSVFLAHQKKNKITTRKFVLLFKYDYVKKDEINFISFLFKP